MAKISVIIPVYNAGEILVRTLLSIRAQSFKDWECICVDDGSSVDSFTCTQDIIKNDDRFLLIRKDNEGTGLARNAGLKRASGQYIMFSDQDDVVHPQAFDLASCAMEKTQADFVSFRAIRWPNTKECVYQNYGSIEDCSLKCSDSPFEDYVRVRTASPCVWHRCFRREAIRDIMFPNLTGGEDRVFMYRVLLHAGREAQMDAVLYYHMENPKSVTRSKSERFYLNELQSYELIDTDFRLSPKNTCRARTQVSRKACELMGEMVFSFSRTEQKTVLIKFSNDMRMKFANKVLTTEGLWLYEKSTVFLFLNQHYSFLRIYNRIMGALLCLFRKARALMRTFSRTKEF